MLTVLHEDPPARHVAACPRGEGVWVGRDAHWLDQVVEVDGSRELQQCDVVVGGELVVLRVEHHPPNGPDGGATVPRRHGSHSHVGAPRTGIRVSAGMHGMMCERGADYDDPQMSYFFL